MAEIGNQAVGRDWRLQIDVNAEQECTNETVWEDGSC